MPKDIHPDWRPPSLKGRLFRGFLKVLAGTVLLAVVLWGIGNWRASRQLSEARQKWETAVADFPEPVKGTLTEEDLAPLWEHCWALGFRRNQDDKVKDPDLRDRLLKAVRWQVWKIDDAPEPLDPQILKDLEAREAELKKIQVFLDSLSKKGSHPIHSMDGYQARAVLRTHQLFILQAFGALAEGRIEDAKAAHESAWILHKMFWGARKQHELQMSLGTAVYHAGFLRQLPDPSPVWKERLDASRYKAQFLSALVAENRYLMDSAFVPFDGYPVNAHGSWATFKVRYPTLARPWIKKDLALYFQVGEAFSEAYKYPHDCRQGFHQAFSAETWFYRHYGNPNRPVQRSQNIYHAVEFLGRNEWYRLGVLTLDFELTRMVMAAKDPERTGPVNPEPCCPPLEWQVHEGKGRIRILLDGFLPWPSISGTTLPLEFQTVLSQDPATSPAEPAPNL